MNRRPSAKALEFVDQVGQRARFAVASVRDPRTRALRRRRRARRSVAVRSVLSAAALTSTAVIGDSPQLELSEIALGSITAMLLLAAGEAVVRVVRTHRAPVPEPAPPPAPLPPLQSAARAPLARLAQAEASLGDLLRVLATPRDGVPALPADALDATRQAAAEAGASLRAVGQSVVAVERAAASAPPAERPALLEAARALSRQLDQGVADVDGLVGAAASAVTVGGGAAPQALGDARDRLTALGMALRELTQPPHGPVPRQAPGPGPGWQVGHQ